MWRHCSSIGFILISNTLVIDDLTKHLSHCFSTVNSTVNKLALFLVLCSLELQKSMRDWLDLLQNDVSNSKHRQVQTHYRLIGHTMYALIYSSQLTEDLSITLHANEA